MTCDVSQLLRHQAIKWVNYIWLWNIHSCFHWYKIYKNRPINARIIVENKVALFFPDTVYTDSLFFPFLRRRLLSCFNSALYCTVILEWMNKWMNNRNGINGINNKLMVLMVVTILNNIVGYCYNVYTMFNCWCHINEVTKVPFNPDQVTLMRHQYKQNH